MTARERLVRTLSGQPADHAPFCRWLGFHPWLETRTRWRRESGIADLDPLRFFGFEPGFATVPAEYGPLPHCEERVIAEDAEFITTTDWRGMTVRNRRDQNSMPEFIGHPIRSADDWKRYKEERLQPRLADRLKALPAFIDRIRAEDQAVQIGTFPFGVFGTLRDMLGTEECLIGFYTEPDLVRDIMDTYVNLWLALYEEVARLLPIDHIHIWEDMSGKQGSLISMAMLEEFMMPHYDRIAAFAKQHHIPVISVDTDGQCDELVSVMMRHGINAFMPFEVQAGNDILAYRRLYPRLGIIGGLDKNALAEDAPASAMHRELDRCEQMLALGGYVPGCDHLIPPNVPWKKWVTFVTEVKRLIGV